MAGNLSRFIHSIKRSQGAYIGPENKVSLRALKRRTEREKERHAELLVEEELYHRGRVAQLLFEINS